MKVDSGKMAERCIWSALLAAVFITIGFWGDWWMVGIAWVMAFPLAMLLGLVIGFIGSWLGWEIDDPQVWAQETEELIGDRSETIIGKFQDADIHEWVMLKRPDNGELVRCMYERTIDMTKSNFEFTPPDSTWFCVMPPGILYVAVHPGNAEPSA
jgi:hypothetical protein